MTEYSRTPIKRREFLGRTLRTGTLIGAGLGLPLGVSLGSEKKSSLRAGEGIVDITPPLGIELAGFHRAPGNERRIEGIRQTMAARALVLQHGDAQVAIISLDSAGVSQDLAGRIQRQVASQTGILASNVRVCATHTHSAPAFCYLRQWGALPVDYMATVEKKAIEAVKAAKADLAPAALQLGKSRAVGGNHNRTTKTFKTDEHFDKDSTEAERWLDTMVHVLVFERGEGKRNLMWYHFSAHPVCYTDEQAGPDWPGLVAQMTRESHQLAPSYLQGHAGDVNPGDGTPWIGDVQETAQAVHAAIARAMDRLERIQVDSIRSEIQEFQVPLDMGLFKDWLASYQQDPTKCASGTWVDARFAKDWFDANAERDTNQTGLPITLAAMRIGDLGLAFHPAELYSYYGLAIRRGSPLPNTIVVGYTDGLIGYLADPQAYKSGEYAAIVVPKILDFPPFTPSAAGQMTGAAIDLLTKVAQRD
ncbi:MAG: neutral/alkaline non-lysosomal ceramidase N-terminal domain-containing protein [Planctomycetes bacterium]|nr:neutral/alkaline non-lysosomal ceramidase N-terminal domain-containing protein [Planctomycetota bacterium]MBL7044063.1 neutral/alkaline non-lysosomal ceramidase N-terminal domain-containing protein [Pirellulaceae bacterium]